MPSPGGVVATWQLCVPGYSMDRGVCSKCLNNSFGRLTKFGIVVVSVLVSVLAIVVPMFVLKPRNFLRIWVESIASAVKNRLASLGVTKLKIVTAFLQVRGMASAASDVPGGSCMHAPSE
jgi:hypothetical protein